MIFCYNLFFGDSVQLTIPAGGMVLARLPILTLLYFCFFFFHSPFFTFAGNFPSTPYTGDHNCLCRCFGSSLGGSGTVSTPRTSTSWSPKLGKLVLTFGRGNTIVTVAIIVITLLNIIVYTLRQLQEANSGESNKPSSSSSTELLCRQFSLAELRLATNNFDQALVIGKGGFGKVYRGLIDHGISVAIKRLDSRSKQGASEFWTEIKMLSKFRHSHLVSLVGYCNDLDEMILVYEYVSGGNLEDHLHKLGRSNGNPPLSWVQRLKICIGAAHALDYLHTGTGVQHRVIHRDVKSSNILLDENLAAKISDLGVSKIGPSNQPCTYVSTDVKGSFGYFDPDYFLTRRLTRKSDVYAFGVVLFEVLCGRPAVDLSLEEDQRGLVPWVQHCMKEGILANTIDPSLRGQIFPNCLTTFVQIADQCLQNRPQERPTMAAVVVKLESTLALQERTHSSIVNKEMDTCGHYDNQEKANGGQSHRKSARIMRVSRMLGHFFSVKARVITVHGDEKPSRKKKHNNRSIPYRALPNKDLLPNKDGDVSQEVPPSWQIATQNLKKFTFAELKRATRNFSRDMVLGEGDFGIVFKGWVDKNTYTPSRVGDGMAIAVERFSTNSMKGWEERQTEVKILGQLSHFNLVNLLGYCWETKELLHVYEYMPKGSLENFIFKKGSAEPLPWAIRLKIVIGAACGLHYLHTTAEQVVFRDFKSSCILLDQDFNAKLADCGLVKSGPINGDTHLSTSVMGTYGYAAPEYIATGHLNVKADIYAFGVVLLEVLTGRPAIDKNRGNQEHHLVDWARHFLPSKRKLKTIMDPCLEHDYPPEGAFQCAAVILKCIQSDPRKRPSMEEVLHTLKQINAINMNPKDGSKQWLGIMPPEK